MMDANSCGLLGIGAVGMMVRLRLRLRPLTGQARRLRYLGGRRDACVTVDGGGMIMAMMRCLLGIWVLVLMWGCATSAGAGAATPVHAARTGPVRIVLAGDSTVNAGSGWGNGFARSFGKDVEVINLAKNGRSSRSFIAEGWWKQCLAAKPDYVLIQFGHNDQPGKGPALETDAQTTYKDFLRQYIEESRGIGAMPVLVTSLERRGWTADGRIKPSLTAYAEAAREVGKEKGVPVIDLNAISIALYEKLGKAAVDGLSATTAQGTVDNTHLNEKGADVIGPIVAGELRKVMPELAER